MAEPTRVTKVPGGVVHYRADARSWLEAAGFLGRAVGDPAVERSVFHESATRQNARFARGPRGAPAWEKRDLALTGSDLWKVFRRAGAPRWPLLHEWEVLQRARDRGIRVPEPIATGMQRGLFLPRADFLVTEDLPGTSLAEALGDIVDAAPSTQHALAVAIGRAVAALHRAGIVFPDLYAKHVILVEASGSFSIGFLDLATASVTQAPTRSERARDLGALAGSLPFLVAPGLMARALSAYVDDDASGWKFADAWNAVRSAARATLRLRRFRAGLAPRDASGTVRAPTREDELIRRFGVPFALDCEDRDADLARNLEPLKRLILATFRAGLLPAGSILPHVRVRDDGSCAWDGAVRLVAPRKARRIHAAWRVLAIRRELRQSALPAAARRELASWLSGPPIAAFVLE